LEHSYRVIRTYAMVCLVCAGATLPVAVLAQGVQTSARDDRPFGAWTLGGIDVGVHDRWRVLVRLGYLGDVDSRILITELSFAAREAIHVLVGQVFVQPTAADVAGTSLLRGGATWLPLRGRVTIDNRFLIERRSTHSMRDSLRGRDRLRLSWSLPGSLRLGIVGSAETIAAAGDGLVENRFQVGGVKSVKRLSVEVYWLQRRIRARPVLNGLGLTALCRVGT
jgi:hypothetical protein